MTIAPDRYGTKSPFSPFLPMGEGNGGFQTSPPPGYDDPDDDSSDHDHDEEEEEEENEGEEEADAGKERPTSRAELASFNGAATAFFPDTAPSPSAASPPSPLSYYGESEAEGEGEREDYPASVSSSLNQYGIELEARRAALQARYDKLQDRLFRLTVDGIVVIGTGSEQREVHLDHPPKEDEKRKAELQAQIEESSATLLGSFKGKVKATDDKAGRANTTSAIPTGNADDNLNSVPTGILSRFTENWGWLFWIDTRPAISVGLMVVIILAGLWRGFSGFAIASEAATQQQKLVASYYATATARANSTTATTVASGNNDPLNPTIEPTLTPLPATASPPTPTIVVATPTVGVASSTKPASTQVVAATTLPATPTTTASLNMAWQPHSSYIPPNSLQIPALSYNANRIVKAQSELDTSATNAGATTGKAFFTISTPVTGTLYHFGGYPGEYGTNLVLVGSYNDLGKQLEMLQQNDQVAVTNRQGGVYTYFVLSYPRLQAKLAQAVLTPTPTTTPAMSTGASAANTTPDLAATAQAFAASYQEDQVMSVMSNNDLSLLQIPGLTQSTATLTLISLPPPGAPPEERLVVRGVMAFANPAHFVLPGTPVP